MVQVSYQSGIELALYSGHSTFVGVFMKERIYHMILVVFMMIGFVAGITSGNKSESIVKSQVKDLLADVYRAKEINNINKNGYKPEIFYTGQSKYSDIKRLVRH